MPASHRGDSTLLNAARHAAARLSIPALAIFLSLTASAHRAGADEAQPLRLCADPTNLPFSSDDMSKPGFYVEVGQALGKALGRPVAYDWYKSYFGKRTVRVTLLGKQCDAMIGLPASDDFMGPSVIFSKPLLTQTYALVSAKGLKLDSIDDLKGKRVAVQYLSTPQNLLAQRDEIDKVTVMSPQEGMTALDQGRADIAFIWGPVAGWLNKTDYNDRYAIRSTEGPGLSWVSAIGFAKGSTELRDQVDAALPALQKTISDLTEKYGFPADAPVRFSTTESAIRHASGILSEPLPIVLVQVATAAAAATPEEVTSGREVFNGTCAHCHGPDAVQAERKIDLRLLKRRHGDDTHDIYWKTVHEGRPSKGMPAWKEVFTDEQLNNVYAYLQTVQTPSGTSN